MAVSLYYNDVPSRYFRLSDTIAQSCRPVAGMALYPTGRSPIPQVSGPEVVAGTGARSPSIAPSLGQGSISGATTVNRPIRRRMRMITSCLECRRRKLKCNKSNPCINCEKFARECVYLSPKLDEASQLRLTEIKEKVGSLERALERDVAKNTANRTEKQQSLVVDEVDYSYADMDAWPADMVARHMSYGDQEEADGNSEDIVDLGVHVSKIGVADGGQLDLGIHDGERQASPLRQGSLAAPYNQKRHVSRVPSPSSILFAKSLDSQPLQSFLPSRAVSDRLVRRYFRAVHPVARCVHQQTFESEYRAFWDSMCSSFEPPPCAQAVVFSAIFSAAMSLDEDTAIREFGASRSSLADNLKLGTETALSKASFLKSTRVQTLQALIIYLIPLCRDEISREHTVLVGSATRMAENMGLHRDGDSLGCNPVETHVRRLIWHQLCFLDIRTAEGQGPRPYIRRDDYDTKLPINCEESSLLSLLMSPEPAEQWTSMVLPLIRFEINEMMRIIWTDRRKLESGKVTLTEVLAKAEDFRKRMIEKYERLIDGQIPIQRYTKLVMHLLLYRLYPMILQGYHSNTESQLPARLNNVVVMAAIMIIEITIQLENDDLYKDWVWHLGAYSQHHIAILLATEIYFRPQNREASRIWACLDYIFGLDRNLSVDTKCALIYNEILSKGRQGSFHDIRSGPALEAHHHTSRMRLPATPQAPDNQTLLGQHLQQIYRQQTIGPSPPSLAARAPPSASFTVGPSTNLWASTEVSKSREITIATNEAVRSHMQPQGSQVRGLEEIDWDTINTIFPPDPTTGEINLAGYHDPSISMNWQQWR